MSRSRKPVIAPEALEPGREEARLWADQRPAPPRAHVDDEGYYGAPSGDHEGWRWRVSQALGSTSPDLQNMVFAELLSLAKGPGGATSRYAEETVMGVALAAFSSVQPRTEFEVLLAVQMIATHLFAMEEVRMGRASTDRNVRYLHANIATKMTRTYLAQAEALAKLQGGGKQQVEVRHVYVDARGGQNIIGDVHGGGGAEKLHQPHEPALEHTPGEACAPLRSKDPEGHFVHGAGSEGQDAVLSARRRKGLGRS
jgi:hypothetical protein